MTETPTLTDTPPTASPPPRTDVLKGFLGDLARPFAIMVTSACAGAATVIIAVRVATEGFGCAAVLTAVYAGVGALYIGKSWEQIRTTQSTSTANATVAIEQARATTGQPT